jgi:hypothetical protein
VIPSPTHLLEQLLAATEAAWAACERGEASPQQLAELVQERQHSFEQLAVPELVSVHERELAIRLCALDQRLLAWCDVRRRELARALASLPHRPNDAAEADGRLLSDFA